jgi:hypothetical protein
MARLTSYDPIATPLLVKYWTRDGLTIAEIAGRLGVSDRTIFRWQAQYPDLCQALKESRELADGKVEDSLFRRACGYDVEVEEIDGTLGEDGKLVGGRSHKTTKHVPPDPTSCIFWLKNRRPDKWRDVTRQENTGLDGGPQEVRVTLIDQIRNELKGAAQARRSGSDRAPEGGEGDVELGAAPDAAPMAAGQQPD